MTGTPLPGMLHIFIAFDWGDEIHLEHAQRLVPPATFHELVRRKRTPSSFTYRPAPLRLDLGTVSLPLPELGTVQATVALTLFDFGAVSLAWRIPTELTPEGMRRLAGALADSVPVARTARSLLQPLYQTLLPAIEDPIWPEDLSEEYFVFQLASEVLDQPIDTPWLAGLVHLEDAPLSAEEIDEALRLKISYGPTDLFIADWTAAVLFDRDCDETLQVVEFANLQLLEFRHIDHRLDESVAHAGRVIRPMTRSILPFWRIHSRPLRQLGELKMEANELFERTSNVLKLIGDSYLARVYRLLATRFYLEAWVENIQRKLEVSEGVYQVLSDQASSFRSEFLEVIIVLLILFEIVMAFVRP